MSDQSSSDDGESDPQHSLSMVFLLVLVFFIMGLVGFLICHVLKKKGYRCRTFRDELDPDNKDVLAELQASEYGERGAGGCGAALWCSLNSALECGLGVARGPVVGRGAHPFPQGLSPPCACRVRAAPSCAPWVHARARGLSWLRTKTVCEASRLALPAGDATAQGNISAGFQERSSGH